MTCHRESARRRIATRRGSSYDSPMPQINTFLTFNHQAEEAARFYTSIFPNSKITRVTRYPDLGPQSPFQAGSVMTVEFTLDGRAFTALNGGPQFTFSQGFSISVLCDTQEQVDEYWDKFVAAGGKPVACGWITDQFGVSWQIDPKLLIDMITDPDPVKAGKAMKAMMTMIKIDSAQLERALAK
jgi:predicted 3-demethylubiquinone-9 3-methyltransferase (glyoxalase superfamily)